MAKPPPGYLTIRNFVHLGRVPDNVKARARRAGLHVVTVAEMRKMIAGRNVLQRAIEEGIWYDTVKY